MALALSHTRCGLPSTQMVRFWRFGFTVRLCTPTCFRPTPPLRLAEPLRVLVWDDLVFFPVTAQTRGMALLRDRPGAAPVRFAGVTGRHCAHRTSQVSTRGAGRATGALAGLAAPAGLGPTVEDTRRGRPAVGLASLA